jgi:RING-finger-containing E3 ubiquitin ligase
MGNQVSSAKPDSGLSTQPEIIRLNQKDDYYQSYLKSKIIDATELLMPWLLNYRMVSRNEDIVKMLTALIYYGVTTLRANQTLGEEYTQLAQYNEKFEEYTKEGLPKVPLKRRILYVFLTAVFPVISHRVLGKLYSRFKQTYHTKIPENSLLGVIIGNLPDYDAIVEKIIKLHVMAFFIEGTFLQLSRRFAGIKLIFAAKPQPHGLHYRNVGYIMLIQLVGEIVRFIIKVYRAYKVQNKKPDESVPIQKSEGSPIKSDNEDRQEGEEAKICTLCFDTRKNTSCTPCGHLFCWDCIIKQCMIKEECPQCRRPCKANKIIQLRNFD